MICCCLASGALTIWEETVDTPLFQPIDETSVVTPLNCRDGATSSDPLLATPIGAPVKKRRFNRAISEEIHGRQLEF